MTRTKFMTRRGILVGLSLVLAAFVAFGLGKATAGDEQTQSPGIAKLKFSGADAQVPTLAPAGKLPALRPRPAATGDDSPTDNGIAPTDPGPTDPGRTNPGPTDPGPTDPGPTDPGPTDPGPTDPGPTEPPPPVGSESILLAFTLGCLLALHRGAKKCPARASA